MGGSHDAGQEIAGKEVINMPGFDATGPWGMGAGTGWGRGPCGAGFRRGGARGRGQGFRNLAWGQPPLMRPWGPGNWRFGPWWLGAAGAARLGSYGSAKDEAAALREEEAHLAAELEAIRKRLAELDASRT